MDIQQLKLFYHFEQYEDQTGKAERFIQDLEELESLAKRLQGMIMDETDQSKGNLIESINEAIEEKVTYSALYYDASKHSMENKAKEYDDIVNKIKNQHVTIHYEVMDMDE